MKQEVKTVVDKIIRRRDQAHKFYPPQPFEKKKDPVAQVLLSPLFGPVGTTAAIPNLYNAYRYFQHAKDRRHTSGRCENAYQRNKDELKEAVEEVIKSSLSGAADPILIPASTVARSIVTLAR